MSTRTVLKNRIDDTDDEFETLGTDDADGDRRMSRYDLLLALLPLPLFVGLGWATLTAAPLSAGAGVGSIPSLVLLAYGLFIGGPTSPTDDSSVDVAPTS